MAAHRQITIADAVKTIDKVWLTQKSASAYLGVSVDFIKDLRLSGQLPYYMLGKLVFIKKNDLDKIIEQHRVI